MWDRDVLGHLAGLGGGDRAGRLWAGAGEWQEGRADPRTAEQRDDDQYEISAEHNARTGGDLTATPGNPGRHRIHKSRRVSVRQAFQTVLGRNSTPGLESLVMKDRLRSRSNALR
ncbi:hypothetical protein GCM10009630_36430 [Kribbella jejuensis]